MREILYKILSEFGMPMGLVVMILKICLNKTFSEVLTNGYVQLSYLRLSEVSTLLGYPI
jgi:hypothetical protein